MASLQPIFSYLGHLATYHNSYNQDSNRDRTHSFDSYRNRRRKRSVFNRYGFCSALTCEGYVTKGFGILMTLVSGKRLAVFLSLMLICWLMVFIRLSFVEVWRHSTVDEYRRDIRKNMDDMDSSLTSYRLIKPLDEERHFRVHSPLDAKPVHEGHSKKKVLIFGYKRGGASVFAEIFNQDPNAMLWYESLDPFYTARFGERPNVDPKRVTENSDETNRELVKSERKWLSDYFRQIYFCQTDNMPLELILHNYMLDLKAAKGFRECVSRLNSPHIDAAMDNCSAEVQTLCGTTVDMSIRHQCPTILNAGTTLRETIRQMEGDLTDYLYDDAITDALRAQFDELLGAALHSLPSDFESQFPVFLRHQFCLASLERTLKPCQPQIVDTCNGKSLSVAHVVRLKSEDLRFILRDFLTLNLVFYVRDPRAIAHSRVLLDGASQTHGSGIGKFVVEEAKDLCNRMLSDYWELIKIQNKFPKVSFIIIKYEDMVMYPYELALEFYNHLGMKLPESYKLYVETHMVVDKAEYLFGSGHPSGNHGNETIYHWRDTLNKNEIRDVNRHCRDVLDLFQYSR